MAEWNGILKHAKDNNLAVNVFTNSSDGTFGCYVKDFDRRVYPRMVHLISSRNEKVIHSFIDLTKIVAVSFYGGVNDI